MNDEKLGKAKRALGKLIARYENHPDVEVMDMGLASGGEVKNDDIRLRIHVRKLQTTLPQNDRSRFPQKIDGIPVKLIIADYKIST